MIIDIAVQWTLNFVNQLNEIHEKLVHVPQNWNSENFLFFGWCNKTLTALWIHADEHLKSETSIFLARFMFADLSFSRKYNSRIWIIAKCCLYNYPPIFLANFDLGFQVLSMAVTDSCSTMVLLGHRLLECNILLDLMEGLKHLFYSRTHLHDLSIIPLLR